MAAIFADGLSRIPQTASTTTRCTRRKVSEAQRKIAIVVFVTRAKTATPLPVKEEAEAVFNLQISLDRSDATLPQRKNVDNKNERE
jgi:hypothetical protein